MLARALRLGLGSATLAAGSSGRVVSGTAGLHGPGDVLPAEPVIDFVVGVGDLFLERLNRAAARVGDTLSPALQAVLQPVAQTFATAVRAAAPAFEPIQQRGRRRRLEAESEAAGVAEALLPIITEIVFERLDTQEMLAKIEIQQIMEATLAQLDIAEIIELVDLESVMEATLKQVDLTEVTIQHIDMQRVMEAAVRDVDVVALLRAQLEGVEIGDLIRSPTSIAGGAIRQTSRLVRRGG